VLTSFNPLVGPSCGPATTGTGTTSRSGSGRALDTLRASTSPNRHTKSASCSAHLFADG
jgi:hypothetical protein